MPAGGDSVAKDAAQGTVWRSQWGWSTSPYNLSILQVRKLRLRDCVPSAHECEVWIQTHVWLVSKAHVLYTLQPWEELALLRWGLQGNGSQGTRLWVLVREEGRRGYSPSRFGAARCQDIAKASAEVPEGSFKSPRFLFRGLVHPAHSLSPSCSCQGSEFQEV